MEAVLLYVYLCILKGEKLELNFSWQKQSTLNCLLKPGKKKGAYGMSTLWFLKTATKKSRAEKN